MALLRLEEVPQDKMRDEYTMEQRPFLIDGRLEMDWDSRRRQPWIEDVQQRWEGLDDSNRAPRFCRLWFLEVWILFQFFERKI
ncbi:hypothetical protein GCK72_020334 [Caenorhabditis remanei]|uniref:Uncharacterized protein n=1 Tax=Caenorhabditis remanei TaxID=31234 RepID=A0A6A5GEW5_CAERE|nr:hypothetical protein GCK72_020334 [Caenorhabditis remanei]KAF1753777.1 hypothetical protein GCK72_020334 [Caenorhabditis remanei]